MSVIARLMFVIFSLVLMTACLDVPQDEVMNTDEGIQLGHRCQGTPGRLAFTGGLSGTFELLVWNIHKLQNRTWQPELDKWGKAADIVLLQEALDTPELKLWFTGHQYKWQQITAFSFEGRAAGVLNAGKLDELFSCSLRTPEPSSRLPKSMLLTLYPLQGSRYPLMVINMHAVNFELGMAGYRQQLEQAFALTQKYPGPVVLAGDFNSWSDRRMALLQQLAGRYQLREVDYTRAPRSLFVGHPLDHIFYRDLTVISVEGGASDGSDHNPLRARFAFK